jgi:hypothetical protein
MTQSPTTPIPRLTGEQLDEVEGVAKHIVNHWRSGANPVGRSFQPVGDYPYIEYRRVRANCQLEDEIKGEYGTRVVLRVPYLNLRLAPETYWHERLIPLRLGTLFVVARRPRA